MKKKWTYTILIPVSFYISLFFLTNTETIFNLIFWLILFLSLIFTVIWSIVLIKQIRIVNLLIFPLLLISWLPVLDTALNIRKNLQEYFRSEIVLTGINDGSISHSSITLRENKKINLKDGGILGTQNYRGNYLVHNDTFILRFNRRMPKYIKTDPSYWIIDTSFNMPSFTEINKGWSFDIKINQLDK